MEYYNCIEVVLPQMTSEFGEIRNVIVTPDMIKRYFSLTKTEILVHLFLLSVCDEDRHIKRNVRALARETERWHADVYRAIMGLKLKKMLEEKQLKTKGSRYWRVYPLPRTRREGKEVEESAHFRHSKAQQHLQQAGLSMVICGDKPACTQMTTPNGELKNSPAFDSFARKFTSRQSRDEGPEDKLGEGTAKKDTDVALNQETGPDNNGKGFLKRVLEKMIRLALE
jgi:predicted transcriptional regulator